MRHHSLQSGEMTNWVYYLGTATVVSGCFGDELEVKWLRECWSKAFDELECSDMDGTHGQVRWKRLDFALPRALQGMIRSSGESLSEDVSLKAREFAQRSMVLRGRQIIWIMIDYFKKNSRSLHKSLHVARHRSTAMAGRREISIVLHTVETHYHQLVNYNP